MGAMNNENSPQVVVIPLGSPSADKVLPGLRVPKKSKLVSAVLINGANLAAADTDYVILELKKGSTVLAELDTRAAHEGALTALVGKPLNLVSAALQELASGDDLSVNYNETDAGTNVALTDAVLVLTLFPY